MMFPTRPHDLGIAEAGDQVAALGIVACLFIALVVLFVGGIVLIYRRARAVLLKSDRDISSR